MVIEQEPDSERKKTYGSTPMKKSLLLILGVLGLLAVAPNESKAQGFSITFGGSSLFSVGNLVRQAQPT